MAEVIGISPPNDKLGNGDQSKALFSIKKRVNVSRQVSWGIGNTGGNAGGPSQVPISDYCTENSGVTELYVFKSIMAKCTVTSMSSQIQSSSITLHADLVTYTNNNGYYNIIQQGSAIQLYMQQTGTVYISDITTPILYIGSGGSAPRVRIVPSNIAWSSSTVGVNGTAAFTFTVIVYSLTLI